MNTGLNQNENMINSIHGVPHVKMHGVIQTRMLRIMIQTNPIRRMNMKKLNFFLLFQTPSVYKCSSVSASPRLSFEPIRPATGQDSSEYAVSYHSTPFSSWRSGSTKSSVAKTFDAGCVPEPSLSAQHPAPQTSHFKKKPQSDTSQHEPQSVQSVPYAHRGSVEPGPPSSQKPSSAHAV